jgi:hypothetical protein
MQFSEMLKENTRVKPVMKWQESDAGGEVATVSRKNELLQGNDMMANVDVALTGICTRSFFGEEGNEGDIEAQLEILEQLKVQVTGETVFVPWGMAMKCILMNWNLIFQRDTSSD